MWKAKITPDKPIRLVCVCGEVRRATRAVWKAKITPDEPIKAHLGVWRGKASDEVCGKQKEH